MPAHDREFRASEELVDVVDESDHVVATVPRSVMRRENLRHRSVGILVRDSDGQVLIHRRSELKDVWPGQWDLAVGGVVASGEDYATAARRELAEEVGIPAPPAVLHELGAGAFEDERVTAVVRCFAVIHDGPVHFADGEVVEARWVSPTELRTALRTQPFVPDSRALFGEFFPEFFAGG